MRSYQKIAICLLICLVSVQVLSPWAYLTPDAVSYLSMARSLAHDGEFLRLGDSQVVYGPTYPVILAPLFLVSDEPFLLLSLLNLGLLAAFGGLAYQWARQVAPDAAAYVACFSVVNVVVLGCYRRPLSETVFCGGLFVLAIGYNKVLNGSLRWEWWLGLVPFQCVLALLRQSAVLMGVGLASAVMWQALRGRRSWLPALLLAALAVGPAAITVLWWTEVDKARGNAADSFSNANMLIPGSRESGASEFPTESIARRLAEGLRVRTAEVGQVTIPGMWKAYASPEQWLNANTLIYSAWFALALVGWVRHLRATDDAIAWAWPFYFALYVYWPFYQSGRFTAPMLPLLAVCLWRAFTPFADRRKCIFAVLIALHLFVSLGYWAVKEAPQAYAIWRHRELFRRLADEFRDRPHEVAVAKEAGDIKYALEFQFDRPIAVDIPANRDAKWVVGWDQSSTSPYDLRNVVVRKRSTSASEEK